MALLTRCREIAAARIAAHRGRIANTAGDAVLAEFPSVADGLSCAPAIQEAVGEANAELPSDRRMLFRIGVHLGDVMVRDGDLFGDADYAAAVEVAKRAIRSYPENPLPYRWLAAALGQLDRIEEAKEALEKAIAIAPGSFDMYVRGREPWMRPEDHAHMLEGLRKAGWRE